jgi:hypothetical protein
VGLPPSFQRTSPVERRIPYTASVWRVEMTTSSVPRGSIESQQGKAGQRVAEEESQRDRQGDRGEVGEAERGSDRHAGDLTQRAARQAVKGGAEGDCG